MRSLICQTVIRLTPVAVVGTTKEPDSCPKGYSNIPHKAASNTRAAAEPFFGAPSQPIYIDALHGSQIEVNSIRVYFQDRTFAARLLRPRFAPAGWISCYCKPCWMKSLASITGFRDELLQAVSPRTVNFDLVAPDAGDSRSMS